MESSPSDVIDFDDPTKLEVKVVHTMMRLQNKQKTPEPRGNSLEISAREIVQYLTENCRYLDGDIESQVKTALLSCVKNGIICVQENSKYRLVGPNPKMMISKCLARSNHGSKCFCLTVLNRISKVKPNNCCTLQPRGRKVNTSVMRRKLASASMSAKSKSKGKSKGKPKSCCDKKKKGRVEQKLNCEQLKTSRCIQNVENERLNIETSKSSSTESDLKIRKCNYCYGYHAKPCQKCYPFCFQLGIPADKFSPSEDVKSSVG
ncbi:hypothetical protein RUM43_007664 [Polyplax serrata]|uniref:Uncharacterized protein n=1 Tax=Polyplax serrata TaxID=468196 RepID=A0AAN8SA81_POLSC